MPNQLVPSATTYPPFGELLPPDVHREGRYTMRFAQTSE